jgi:hypothetical protein
MPINEEFQPLQSYQQVEVHVEDKIPFDDVEAPEAVAASAPAANSSQHLAYLKAGGCLLVGAIFGYFGGNVPASGYPVLEETLTPIPTAPPGPFIAAEALVGLILYWLMVATAVVLLCLPLVENWKGTPAVTKRAYSNIAKIVGSALISVGVISDQNKTFSVVLGLVTGLYAKYCAHKNYNFNDPLKFKGDDNLMTLFSHDAVNCYVALNGLGGATVVVLVNAISSVIDIWMGFKTVKTFTSDD